jgi:triphosphoribosyl-dephospho-CoA synthetase
MPDLSPKLTRAAELLTDAVIEAATPRGPAMPWGVPAEAKEAAQALGLVMAELRRLGETGDPDAETAEDAEFRRVLQKAGIDVADL